VTDVQPGLGMKAKPAIIFDESGRIVGEIWLIATIAVVHVEPASQ